MNPYHAPPPHAAHAYPSAPPAAPQATIYSEGSVVVFARGSQLPPYCVKCGQAAPGALATTLHWHPSWVGVTILLSPLAYVLVATLTRKSERVAIPLCAPHMERRRRAVIGGWASAALFGALTVISTQWKDEAVIVGFSIGLLGLVIAPLVAYHFAATLQPTLIDDRMVRVKGAGPGFLRGLSPAPWRWS